MSFSGLQEEPQKGPKMGLKMDLQRDRKRTPKGSSKRAFKDGFQVVAFRNVVQHRMAFYRVALHRIRVALTFDQNHKAFKKQKQGIPEYSLQRTLPP